MVGPGPHDHSKEQGGAPASPSVSSSSSSSPRHWTGTSELDELHGRAKTRRPLPEGLWETGVRLPEFDYATLGEVDEPMASGKQAFVYEVTVHRKRAALKVMRANCGSCAERRALCGSATSCSDQARAHRAALRCRRRERTALRSVEVVRQHGHQVTTPGRGRPRPRCERPSNEWPSRALTMHGRARRRPGPFAHARYTRRARGTPRRQARTLV